MFRLFFKLQKSKLKMKFNLFWDVLQAIFVSNIIPFFSNNI
jgi:hypothetical protein